MLVTPQDSPLCLDKARVVIPFTRLQPDVLAAVRASGRPYECVNVSDSDESYFRLLSELWAAGESFTLVEHDVIVGPETLASFDDCPHLWCAAKYSYLKGSYWGLGCTRFRGPLLKQFPGIMDEVGEYKAPRHSPRHWCTLDQALTHTLSAHRVEFPHIHGEVEHLGDGWPAHRCRARPVGS
jgi:hypothetical protein